MESQADFDLIGSMAATFQRCTDIATKKNADYAGVADPFANFKAAPALLSGVSVEKGILVRLTDKIKRIDNLLSHDAYVTEESMSDTIEDAINYLAILLAWRQASAKPIVFGAEDFQAMVFARREQSFRKT